MPPCDRTSLNVKRPMLYETVDVFDGSRFRKVKREIAPHKLAFVPTEYETVDVFTPELGFRKLRRLYSRTPQTIAVVRDGSRPTRGGDPKKDAREYAKWLFPSGTPFYDVLRDLARRARQGDASAIGEINTMDALSQKNRHFRQEIANRVRVKATKKPGDLAGTGLDELYMTSRTMYFLKWAAGMVKGKQAESTVRLPNGKNLTFTVLDLQERFRLPTSVVLTLERQAHVGALFESRTVRRYLTKGQPGLHRDRQRAIDLATTPLEALHAGLRAHLEFTPNAPKIREMRTGVHVSGKDLSDSSDRTAIHRQFIGHRDALKAMAEEYARVFPPPQRLEPLSPPVLADPKNYDFKAIELPRLTDELNKLLRR